MSGKEKEEEELLRAIAEQTLCLPQHCQTPSTFLPGIAKYWLQVLLDDQQEQSDSKKFVLSFSVQNLSEENIIQVLDFVY